MNESDHLKMKTVLLQKTGKVNAMVPSLGGGGSNKVICPASSLKG